MPDQWTCTILQEAARLQAWLDAVGDSGDADGSSGGSGTAVRHDPQAATAGGAADPFKPAGVADVAALEAAVSAAAAATAPVEEELAWLKSDLDDQLSYFHELRGSLQVIAAKCCKDFAQILNAIQAYVRM